MNKLMYRLLCVLVVGATAIVSSYAQISIVQDYVNRYSAPIGVYQGINFRESGFSGMYPIPGTNGKEFWIVGDRGPNIDAANANSSACRPTYDKIYAFPSYAPKIHRVRIAGDSVQILRTITIKRPSGQNATGLINPTGFGSTSAELASTDTVLDCANFMLKTAAKDVWGIDAEGLVVDKQGFFWICEEGGASIWKVNPNGVVVQRFSPYANLVGAEPQDVLIDTVFKYRKNNRGFEGIALAPNGKIYAIIQSPILYPTKSVGEGTRIHRILEIDPTTNAQRMFAYLNDGIIGASGSNQIRLRDWKIGDMAAINDTTFLVLEAALRSTTDIKRLYKISLNGATAVHSGLYNGVTLEALVDSLGLANNSIVPVKKTLVMDLLANGYNPQFEKAEGLAIINDSTIAICNDNDFGAASPAENGIATATNLDGHIVTYRLSGANKLVNFVPVLPSLSQGITAPSSSTTPYITPSASGVQVTSILTVGDAVNGYKLCGIPDGLGAFDNNDGTFTLLVNHELSNTLGVVRAHGNKGAFVSKWTIRKNDLAVLNGSDLIKQVYLWNNNAYSLFNASRTSSASAFNRFCSADLAPTSAFFTPAANAGTLERLFLTGEEGGTEGRAFAHIVTGVNAGTSYELPWLGKFAWENAVARPYTSMKTVVVGLDDGTGGQVYVYIGTKQNTGNEVERAGLNNGKLYGIKVQGVTTEGATAPAENTAFTLVDVGNPAVITGDSLNKLSIARGVTTFLRPEDGVWDTQNPSDFYFVTTNAFTAPSRLWRLRFTNVDKPELGGTITAVLDGTEGQKMLDNMTMDNYGNILLQEDVGNQSHNGKIWQYTIATDELKLLAQHDSTRFVSGSANYLTQDEESSGIIDMQNILGPGMFLSTVQAHYPTNNETVEGGQLVAIYNPYTNAAFAGAKPSTSSTPYVTPIAPGVKVNSVLTVLDSVKGYKMCGIPDGLGAFDNGNGTFTLLMNHELGTTSGVTRAHGNRGAFVSKWIINKSNLSVQSGSDLIRQAYIWNGTSYTLYNSVNVGTASAFGRFCSADLAPVTAFFNQSTGLGVQDRIFLTGEENGLEGRGFAHIASGAESGTSYELPYLGKFSWENAVASPTNSDKTIVVGLDDGTGGQVYVYVGAKKNTGNTIEKAGLTGGKLYGVKVQGLSTEGTSAPAPNTTFTLADVGNAHRITGDSLNKLSIALGVTTFLRPEDGAWDPNSPNDFYFVTTNAFTSPSRLWRMRFTNVQQPELGGTITAVLDGTEGQKMLDNMCIDTYGHVMLQEDVGNQAHLGKIWQYTIATDELKLIAQHDSTRFVAGGSNYLTQDEESSGILDMQSILGAGMFMMVTQAHYPIAGEAVEGGQLLTLFNPDTYSRSTEIAVKANNIEIVNNDATPSTGDNTDYGTIKLGTSKTQSFTITNTGTAPLRIASIDILGTNAEDFYRPATTSQNIVLESNASITIKVTCSPTVVGTRTATLQIKSNDYNESTYTFALKAIGENIQLLVKGNGSVIRSASATNQDNNTHFGSVVLGKSKQLEYTIENYGASTTQLTSVSFAGTHATDYKVASTVKFPINVVKGTRVIIPVVFTPRAAGARTSTISLKFSDVNKSTYTFNVGGNGEDALPEIDVWNNLQVVAKNDTSSSSNTNFGSVYIGSSARKEFVIVNKGTGLLTITKILLQNGSNKFFTLEQNRSFPYSLQPNASSSFTVHYNPQEVGSHNATVYIQNSDDNESLFEFSLKGKATNPLLSTEEDNTNEISIYPNPSSGNVTVNVPNNTNQEITFSIVNQLGTQVYSETMAQSHVHSGAITLTTNPLPQGAYTLVVSTPTTRRTFNLILVR